MIIFGLETKKVFMVNEPLASHQVKQWVQAAPLQYMGVPFKDVFMSRIMFSTQQRMTQMSPLSQVDIAEGEMSPLRYVDIAQGEMSPLRQVEIAREMSPLRQVDIA